MQPPSRDWRPHAEAGSHGALGALRSGGVRTLMLATLPIGFCFGAVEISLPAFAKQYGAPEWAGVLLSIWALASAVGGLAYGARNWRLPLDAVYLRLAALLPLGFLPALAAPSVAAMALLILPAGLLIAPLGAAGNQLIGQVAPAGAVTEAYTLAGDGDDRRLRRRDRRRRGARRGRRLARVLRRRLGGRACSGARIAYRSAARSLSRCTVAVP